MKRSRVPFAVLTALPLACGGGGTAAGDASVDARRDGKEQVADVLVDRSVHDAASHDAAHERDVGLPVRHYIDAAVVCDGGTGWGPCIVTDAAELACDASADCTWQANGSCCGLPTFGVNKSAPFVGCPGLPCGPPKGAQPACQELYTQDCRAVAAAADVVVACVNHRCMTRAGSD